MRIFLFILMGFCFLVFAAAVFVSVAVMAAAVTALEKVAAENMMLRLAEIGLIALVGGGVCGGVASALGALQPRVASAPQSHAPSGYVQR